MRILIIAPDAQGIATTAEIDAIAPSHHTEIVSGLVTQQRIAIRIAQRHYDIIHFLAHGTPSGIQLSDRFMSPEEIARLAKHTRARMVFLNACGSTIPGQYLVDVGIPAAIVHNREVPDSEAVQVAAYFYNELAVNGGDMRAAYSVANPHDGTLSWLSNGNYRDSLLNEIALLKDSGDRREERMIKLYQGYRHLMIATAVQSIMVAGLWIFQAWR